MTAYSKRSEEIERLRLRLASAMRDRKRKTTTIILARLRELVLRQINFELSKKGKAA